MAKPYGLANQKLCYVQMLLNVEKSGEQDQECSQECRLNTDPDQLFEKVEKVVGKREKEKKSVDHNLSQFFNVVEFSGSVVFL